MTCGTTTETNSRNPSEAIRLLEMAQSMEPVPMSLYEHISLNAAAGKPGTLRHRVAVWAAEILLSAICRNPSLRGQLRILINSLPPGEAKIEREGVLPKTPVSIPMPPVQPTRGARPVVTTFAGERRTDHRGRLHTLKASFEGYVVTRSPGCAPVVMLLCEWQDMAPAPIRE